MALRPLAAGGPRSQARSGESPPQVGGDRRDRMEGGQVVQDKETESHKDRQHKAGLAAGNTSAPRL